MKNILCDAVFSKTEKRISSLSSACTRKWGMMTLEQMLSHCADQIRLARGEKTAHEKPGFINRNIAKYVGLWLPQIPVKNLRGPVDMDWQLFGSKPGDVESGKQQLISLLQQFRSAGAGSNFYPHPMFGKLNRSQWARFMYVHIDHHLRQFSV